MNYMQFGLFIVFLFSVLIAGIRIYSFINKNDCLFINRYTYLGETLLLGSIYSIGFLLLLSLIGLYKAPYLWSVVTANYLFILHKDVRKRFLQLFFRKIDMCPATLAFFVVLIVFIFRNCYFLIDVDSNSTYLFTQKLWLSNNSSLIGSAKDTFIIFLPQFDVIPYSLGLSVFGQETLFPLLINVFWRVIVVLLLFGYTGYRFNKYYGLAAVLFTILNEHFFYSGANHWVLINGVVIALLFASAYNFWESCKNNDLFRFTLALIFLSQLLANKYQMVYVSVFILGLGFLIQPNLKEKIRGLLANKKLFYIFLSAVTILSFWFIKNFIVTGDPVFPGLAGKFKSFNWTPDQERTFIKVFGGIKPLLFLKYMNYLFIWPGMSSAKFVILIVSFLPIILLIRTKSVRSLDRNLLKELTFWLGLSLLVVMGLCLSSHQDSRYYRYAIAILSFTAVMSLSYFFRNCLNLKSRFFVGGIILLFAFKGGSNEGYKTIYKTGGSSMIPTFAENRDVLLNKIHAEDAVKKHYPQVARIENILNKNKDKLSKAAWDMKSFNINIPQFLLPKRPVVSMWYSTLIRWDSYSSPELIVKDLENQEIEWIIALKDDDWVFMPIKDYAVEAAAYDKYPKQQFYSYHTVPELKDVHYDH